MYFNIIFKIILFLNESHIYRFVDSIYLFICKLFFIIKSTLVIFYINYGLKPKMNSLTRTVSERFIIIIIIIIIKIFETAPNF